MRHHSFANREQPLHECSEIRCGAGDSTEPVVELALALASGAAVAADVAVLADVAVAAAGGCRPALEPQAVNSTAKISPVSRGFMRLVHHSGDDVP